MGRAKSADRVVIVCGYPGCDKSQALRRSRLVKCDGYMCREEHAPGHGPPPGRVREVVGRAAGGFGGWRDVVPGAAVPSARAGGSALTALLRAVPRVETYGLASALVAPAGRGRRHFLGIVGGWSAGADVGIEITDVAFTGDGRVEMGSANAVALAVLLLRSGGEGRVVLGTITDETAFFARNGMPVAVREVRGWGLAGHALRPFSAEEVHAVMRADEKRGTPARLERGARPADAWPVDFPIGSPVGSGEG